LAQLREERLLPSFGSSQQVDVVELARASRLAYALADDPALALRAGCELPAHTLGVSGLLMVEAPTFRAALLALQRCWPLLCSRGSCALLIEGDRARFVLELATDSGEAQRVACEFAFAFILRVGRIFAGQAAAPSHVSFPYPAPEHVRQYADCFGCALRFEGDRAEFAFPVDWLYTPRAFTDEDLLEVLEREAEALLSRVVQTSPMRERVYSVLMADPSLTDGDAHALAKLLGLSVSKLRRALQAEGETLLVIADEVRIDRARSLLAAGNLSIKAISEQLGYSQPSAFHRAFKRKTGMSPLLFRRQDAS
jgi:AraC-like DNA-binding protein